MIALNQFTLPDGSATWFDVLLEDGDLATDEGLESAVTLSLFLDRRAEPDDVTDDDDKRGWWADDLDGDPIGSRLWLLSRSKTVPDVLRQAEEFAEEALAWLIEDKVAQAVSAVATRLNNHTLNLRIRIERQSGERWDNTWELQLNGL